MERKNKSGGGTKWTRVEAIKFYSVRDKMKNKKPGGKY